MNQERDIFEEFACSLEKLSDIVRDITMIEKEQSEAAARKRHDTMDGFLKQEQALLLKLRGQEQKRLRLAESLGWGGLTFQQILDQASESQCQRLKPLFDQLNAQVKLLLETKDTTERIIKVRLREFETLLSMKQRYVYNENGVIDEGIPSSFHERYV